MLHVVKPGGIVAVRESTSLVVYPGTEGLITRWGLGARMRQAKGTKSNESG